MQKIVIDLKSNHFLTYAQLLSELVALNYQRVPMVLEKGEFAVRGNIVDIYASNHSHPIRIEYGLDKIERLNAFMCHNQRSLSALNHTEILAADTTPSDFIAVPESQPDSNVLSEFKVGDAVVHEDYGIGIYKGLTRLQLKTYEGEYMSIQYKNNDKLYVPIDKLHLLHRYSDNATAPVINRLHDGLWQRTKKRAKKATELVAADVYFLYKLRQTQRGFSCEEDTLWQIELERDFEYQETKDQLRVLTEVKKDMQAEKPMDRLICGDVGYGKTEVLIRAAFKALENNKQVAVLVPTTILAEQHFRVFSNRLEKFPYRVAVLSRFKKRSEQLQIIEEIKCHKIDLVIGTHRLLQADIGFADLGLLVIDEEQRFGVSHKERIKKLKTNVDVLSVSATPIPRTLYMALTGARDFSNIETPPENRKPVLTCVAAYSDEIVKKAIASEVTRGGQVFYVYNTVAKMPQKRQQLQHLMPNIRFAFAHGQMRPEALEDVMKSFLDHKCDVLLCSTIIENGMDITSANTIILDSVEHFGLSQIHQLRGRVGRSEVQAYAYLLHTPGAELTGNARERLQAIREYTVLGAGYHLAMRDLEIRGAGTLLGKKQHGHVTEVGFELYCKLLEESVHEARYGRKPIMEHILINPEVKAYIPDDYIADMRERLAIYKRLMALEQAFELEILIQELEDRYGALPMVVTEFFHSIKKQLDKKN